MKAGSPRPALPTRPRARPASPPDRPARWPSCLWIGGLVACASADVFRIGFFADDFHFLDVARRMAVGPTLLGRYGIYPWYRPLSRELYFRAIVAAGPAGLFIAHLLSVACLLAIAWVLFRLGMRLFGPRAAAVAPVLFVTYGFTKFLTAWASGFQDMLASLLVLGALLAHVAGRRGLAVACVALAPFAKETGFLAAPLIGLYVCLCEGARRLGPRTAGPLLASLVAAGIHWVVRTTWPGAGTAARIDVSATSLLPGVGQALGAFVSVSAVGGPSAVALGAVAGLCAAALVRQASTPGLPMRTPGPARALLFVSTAAAIGIAPMVVSQLLRLTNPHPYYAFPAAPWLALVLSAAAARMPAGLIGTMLAGIAGINVAGLGAGTPDLDSNAGWLFRRWDFAEAARLSAASRRLGDDLRQLLRSRPDSLNILYGKVPEGCLFQTEDGPATRESLRDPTVRAFYLSQAPPRLEQSRFVIVGFDEQSFHLIRENPGARIRFQRASTALVKGQPRAAFAWAAVAPDSNRFELAYVRAAAALEDEGAPAFETALLAGGFGDSTGSAAAARAVAAVGDGDAGLRLAMETVLRHPRSAPAHAALGDSFMARGASIPGGVELRIATGLDPGRVRDRLELGRLLTRLGEPAAARREFDLARKRQ